MYKTKETKSPFSVKVERFFDAAEKYKPEIDKNIIELVKYVSELKRVTCMGDFSLLTNLSSEQLRNLEVFATDAIGLYITVEAILIFARAVRVQHHLNEYNAITDKDSKNRKFDLDGKEAVNPFGLAIKVTPNGIEAVWYSRHADLHFTDYPKGWDDDPKPNRDGNYGVLSFIPAVKSVREFIHPTYESILQGLRAKTKRMSSMRDELNKYRAILGLEDSGLTLKEEFKTSETIKSLPRIDPSLSFMMQDAGTFEDEWFTEVPGDEYYLDYSFDDLKKLENEADKNLAFFLRLLKTVLFIEGAKVFKQYYDKKRDFFQKNKYAKRGSWVRMPYYPVVQMTKNGVCIGWIKLVYGEKGIGLARAGDRIAVPKSGKYPKSAFKDASKQAQEFICDEIEPQFVDIRVRSAICSALKRCLWFGRLIHEKYYQKGSNRVG